MMTTTDSFARRRGRSNRSARVALAAFLALLLTVAASAAHGATAAVAPSSLELPTLGGIAREGATLTADPGVWSGDAPIAFTYAWEQCDANGASCVPIPLADAATYVIPSTAPGATLRVAVTAANAAGATTSRSFVSGLVAPAGLSPANARLPLITGTVQQGLTVVATSGSWNGRTPISFTYEWQRCGAAGDACVSIDGARSAAYTLAAADIGLTIRVAVTASSSAGIGKAYSGATKVVASASAPALAVLPAITGIAKEGQVLTASSGSWSGTQPIAYAYQWWRCDAGGGSCVPIADAIAPTYTATAADVARTLRASVTASNVGGSAAALTPASSIVASSSFDAPVSTAAPVISGPSEVAGTLTASSGAWAGSVPLTFAYTWLSCDAAGTACKAIAGAITATYVPVIGDLGRTLRVQVVATNGAGSAGATSAQTVPVAAPRIPVNIALPVIYASSAKLKAGDVLTASVGTWLGARPMGATFQWTRCSATEAFRCSPIAGATKKTYTVVAADLGRPLFVQVKVYNQFGQRFANSRSTPNGISGQLRIATAPVISGSPAVGATLSVSPGTWVSSSPITYTYQWTRCQAGGPACTPIANAKRPTYTVTPADSDQQLFVQIKAISAQASVFANSARTQKIVGTGTIAAASVVLPNRLVISDVKFTPSSISSRAPFIARFRVMASGRPVQGALVYALGIPYSWVAGGREVVTDADGWATMQITPTARLPLERGNALVMFVRARKAGDNILAGVSTRRLVQVVIR
jgi:hypothetical protein